MLPCEFCDIFKSIFFYGTPPVAAFDNNCSGNSHDPSRSSVLATSTGCRSSGFLENSFAAFYLVKIAKFPRLSFFSRILEGDLDIAPVSYSLKKQPPEVYQHASIYQHVSICSICILDSKKILTAYVIEISCGGAFFY